MREEHPCILVVEDERLVADGLTGLLRELDLGTCQVARTFEEAVRAAEEHTPLLIIMDLQLRGNGDGVDAAKKIHEHLDCPIIFTTGDTAPSALLRIFEDKPSAVLRKPFSADDLLRAIRTALRERVDE